MPANYPPEAYDDDLCLKMPAELLLCIAYLLRPYLIMIFSLTNRKDRMGLIEIAFADRSMMALTAIAALPAIAMIVAIAKKNAETTGMARTVWHKGRIILLSSSAIHLAIMIWVVFTIGMHNAGTLVWLQLGAGVLVTAYLLTSRRVIDVFDDYPKPKDESEGPRKRTKAVPDDLV